MKVIVTGATGFIGGEVVKECIENDQITEVIALTRKELPKELAHNSKVTVVIHEDFSQYPAEILQQLEGAEVCIWTIGGRANQFPDAETYRKVQVDYTLAAANAFMEHLAPKLELARNFYIVFCSGKYAENDLDKSLAFMADTRRAKGEAENGLIKLAEDEDKRLEVWCVRPSGVLPADAGVLNRMVGKLIDAISVQQLAKAMVKIAIKGYPKRIIESYELLKM